MKHPAKPNPAIIAGKTFKEIFLHPITYTPTAAIAVANALVPIAWWANLPLIVVAVAGEILFWRRNWTPIYERHEAEEEAAHAKVFNQEILNSIARIRGPVWDLVEGMVRLKEQAEACMLADKRINTKEREILDILEDTLIQTAESAAENSTVTQEMKEAADAIKELVAELDSVLQPLNPTPEEKKVALQSGLAQSTQALRNRMEESRQVKKLIEDAQKPRA